MRRLARALLNLKNKYLFSLKPVQLITKPQVYQLPEAVNRTQVSIMQPRRVIHVPGIGATGDFRIIEHLDELI